jgi:hypothetical protein
LGLIDNLVEAVIALFLIIIFASIILPAIAEVTGAEMTWGIILFILLAIAVVASLLKGLLR